MKNVHFAIPEIYGDSLSYYEVLRELIEAMNVIIDNYDTIPEQIADAVKNLDASQLFSAVLNQLIHSIATDNTKSANAVKVYKKHDLLYATFNETVNLYESLIDFTAGTETELVIGTNIREVNISELFIELRKLIDINKNNIEGIDSELSESRHSNISNRTYDTLSARLDSMENYVTPEMFGAVSDGIHDDTNAFREAIRSGLPVYVPNGKYLITDTIYIPKATTIYGVDNKCEWFKNANIEPDNGAIIKFNPSTMKTLFVLEDSELEVGYCPNVSISNLTIVGCPEADVCINFRNACHSSISNVFMTHFKVGLSISYNMLNTFTNVKIQKCSSFNILINGEISTTCNFYDCYIGQNTDSNAIGMFIDDNSGYGLSFYSLTIESVHNGIKISDRNEVSFHGIYSENTPNTTADGYMMKVGSHGYDTATSIVSLFGGTIQGNNDYNIDSHYAIELTGKNNHVNVYGVKFLIFEKILNLLDNEASASFSNCIEISTKYNIEDIYNANAGQVTYTNCDSVIVPVKNRNRYKLSYVAFESTTWTPYQSGCYATSDNYFYIVRISATANGNIVGKLPFKPLCEVYTKLLDLSLGDTFIDCYIDGNGNIMVKGQTDGHVYKGQIIIHSSNIIK